MPRSPLSSLAGHTVLIIFAKEPLPGQVKTRLCPPLSPQAAARLYGQFLKDVLEEMAGLPQIPVAWHKWPYSSAYRAHPFTT